ncbi:hypothetical protein E6P09_18140 (plasmid) [Haloferax mediterranei ATCC 33500]|uniref:Uncharacterized protein n=1 Tax=Haloferax mediterranei (strain ATCC 33500 / DSM 1411 / JCM 8866 / NBRC 14739 / NCIMB 2177 / R-4) TaxID=523841 RepID=I3RA27_HALMT|nr:hypothetical protein [Haloferax mediterranei]AFK21087.1 hypothetical protein HFX_5255 [Haloferax mediterranei ATCC 33500]AHZ24324.1 hypothetical protein BM92_19185 [Haloferax mediterranei ATCC 33500]EMA05410.1 hypothetical protein C439_01385 [Haloferax mediterranei ATCC 33500]MDX5989792.1 hypothetical protein [Haloferax mediterranei ATCC 33500]QCQ77236.1 hypothetical protein E6P09_18140 [Haloferax mediterranei ATCC 33500]
MPPLLSSGIALLAAIATLVITAVSTYTLAASALGVFFLLVGLVRGSTEIYTLGTVLLVVAIILAGMLGMAPLFLLTAAFFALIAWDVGQNGFSIADEVGSGVSTLRIEMVHAVSSSVVFAAGSSVGYAVFLTMTGRQPVLALVALLVGVVALLLALQR